MKKYLILLLVFISLFSCRVAKKSWVEETFAEKSNLTEAVQKLNDSTTKRFQQISNTFQSKFQEISNSKSESETSSESENTSVSGSITAEDGKEKSVTIGGTTIKSNGANITFDVNTSKAISKEFQTKFQELSNQLQWKNELTENIQLEVRSLKREYSELKASYESEKNAKSKEVTKRGVSFGVLMIGIIVIIILIALWYFRKQLPFLK